MPATPRLPTDPETKQKLQKHPGHDLSAPQGAPGTNAPARQERAVSDVEEPSLPEDDA